MSPIAAGVLWAIAIIIALKLFHPLYRYIVLRRKLMKLQGEPYHWLWGHTNQFSDHGEELVKYALKCSEKFKSEPYRAMVGPFVISCVLSHPDDIQAILKSEPKAEVAYRLLRPWLGDGLLIAGGERWQRSRRLLTPAFHFEILRPYISVYRECVNAMLDLWSDAAEKGDPVELTKYVTHMSCDVLLQCIFSYKSGIQTGARSPYVDAVHELSELVTERMLFPPHHSNLIYNLSPSGWRFRRANRVAHEFSKKVIDDRRKALENKDTSDQVRTRKYLDFLDILIEAKDEHGIGLTDNEIRNEVDTFMFEGHDTTSSGIMWSLYCLAKYPQFQQMCRDEVEEILSNGKTELEWNDMNSLVFTTQFIKEAMRLFPPVPNIHRDVTSDIQLHDTVLPKGAWAFIDILCLHHNPLVWDDPEEFRPSRFSTENSKGRHPYAYVPFSAGPRNCIGQNFALNEERVAVAMTVYRYELIEIPDHPVERLVNLILKPRYGIKIQLKPIKR